MNTDEYDLLKSCISGDRQAAESFVLKYSNLIYQTIQHTLISKNIQFARDDLEDFHNTIFMHIFENRCQKLRQFKGKNGCSIGTWLRTIATRIMLNLIRKRGVDSIIGKKQLVSLDRIEQISEIPSNHDDPWAALNKSQQEQILKNSVLCLDPRERLFYKLHFTRELPLPEVARLMNISTKNTYTIKHRIILKIKAYAADAAKK